MVYLLQVYTLFLSLDIVFDHCFCPQKGEHFLYLHRLNPSSVQRYRLEREELGLSPLRFSASYRNEHICLLYLCKLENPSNKLF